MSESRLRLAVLLSGSGRTLENLLRVRECGEIDVDVVAVASNRGGVRGLDIAREAGLPTRVFRLSGYENREARDAALGQWVREHDPQLVMLAGYLALLDLDALKGVPVINIHPSLLPRHGGAGFYGDRVHEAVLAAGDTESGCTVHEVDAEFDRGRILAQRRVPVLETDDAHALAARVFAAECELYPEVVGRIARGEWSLVGAGEK